MTLRTALVTAALSLLALALPSSEALAQATGILDVQANVEEAWVIIDDEPAGQTPFLEIIEAGKHTVTIRRDGFEDFSQEITLKADTSVEIRARLVRIEPGLIVTVDVDDARVSIDGKQVGTGQRVVVDPAPRGKHEVTVEAEGYGSWNAQVNLSPGVVTPVEVNLRGSLGSIVLASKPNGATVWLDGEEKGVSPITIEPVSPGSHGLRLEANGRSVILQQIIVDPGKTVDVSVSLVKEAGSLEVRPSVSSARVLVNGVDMGEGKQSIENLKPGTYSVRVTAADHTDFIKSVTVEDGKKVNVAAKLEAFSFGGRNRRLAGAAPKTNDGATPLAKRPGFWAAVGGGVGAAVAVAVIAGAASTSSQPEPDPDTGLLLPTTDLQLALP